MPARLRRTTATIIDVARIAGVSKSTVSRALREPKKIAPTTLTAILDAIKATGYRPNATAQQLRARATKMTLVLIPGMHSAFFPGILNALEDELWDGGYGVILGDTRGRPEREARYIHLIRTGQVDGMIVATGRIPTDGPYKATDSNIPITLVSMDIPDEPDLPLVDVANRDSARAAVNHLIALGHRRIGHVSGAVGNIASAERRAGYEEALAGAGIALDPSIVWQGINFRYESGQQAALEFLASDHRPTAVFVAADDSALGFIKTITDHGVRVPRDVSIIGFDDVEYARIYQPALTTVRQPRAEMGRLAARQLLELMTRTPADPPLPRRIRLACEVVVRDTTAPPSP